MKIRSTGLGKTELRAEPASVKPQGSYLVITLQTLEPVRWQVRAALTPADLRRIVGLIFNWKIILYILPSLFKRWHDPGPPIDF